MYEINYDAKKRTDRLYNRSVRLVASPGIEPGSGASETLILSIVLRGRHCKIILVAFRLAFNYSK